MNPNDMGALFQHVPTARYVAAMAILCSETLRLREHREQLAKEPRGIQGDPGMAKIYGI